MEDCPQLESILETPGEEIGLNVAKHGDYVVKTVKLSERFEREKRAWLQAYAIPQLRAILPPFCYIGEDTRNGYIVQRHVPVRSLQQFLKQTPIPANVTIRLADDLEKMFAILWATGYVHNDVKPANILITNDTQRPILIDVETMTPIATQGDVVGTRGYYPSSWTTPMSQKVKSVRKKVKVSGDVLTPYYSKQSDSFALARIFEQLLEVTDWAGRNDVKQEFTERIQRLRTPIVASLTAELARRKVGTSRRRRLNLRKTRKAYI